MSPLLRMVQMHCQQTTQHSTAQDETKENKSASDGFTKAPFTALWHSGNVVLGGTSRKTIAISVPLAWTRAFFSWTVLCAVLSKPFDRDIDKRSRPSGGSESGAKSDNTGEELDVGYQKPSAHSGGKSPWQVRVQLSINNHICNFPHHAISLACFI